MILRAVDQRYRASSNVVMADRDVANGHERVDLLGCGLFAIRARHPKSPRRDAARRSVLAVPELPDRVVGIGSLVEEQERKKERKNRLAAEITTERLWFLALTRDQVDGIAAVTGTNLQRSVNVPPVRSPKVCVNA